MDLTQRLGAILRALDIWEIEYALNGEGDSGEATLERVAYRNGTAQSDLPEIAIFITDTGDVRHLAELLENIVAEAPEGDWVNNEGGYGSVIVRPFEDEEGLSIDCNMTYRDEDDYGDDDEDFIDEEPDADDQTGTEVDVSVVIAGEVEP